MGDVSCGGAPPYTLPSGRLITGTMVWYYFICKREVWLISREITPEEDESLEVGRAVHEIFYRSMRKEFPWRARRSTCIGGGRGLCAKLKLLRDTFKRRAFSSSTTCTG